MSGEFCCPCYGVVADLVVDSKGLYSHQSKGGDSKLLHRIWCALGSCLVEQLVSKRSCIVTDFFHASIKKQTVPFFSGVRDFYKPQFVLLPDFLSKYHLQNVLTMHDAHYHATVPHIISYATVASFAGTDRFTVQAAVCDSIREIGRYIVRNPQVVLNIDIGIALLEFRGREYRVKWSNAFLERLKDEVGPHALISPYDPPSMLPEGTGCRPQAI